MTYYNTRNYGQLYGQLLLQDKSVNRINARFLILGMDNSANRKNPVNAIFTGFFGSAENGT